MGVQVNLRCDCGCEKRVSLGGGMANYQTVCNFPHCGGEGGVVTATIEFAPAATPRTSSDTVRSRFRKHLIR